MGNRTFRCTERHKVALLSLDAGFISRTLYREMVGEGWSWFASRGPYERNQNFFVKVQGVHQGVVLLSSLTLT